MADKKVAAAVPPARAQAAPAQSRAAQPQAPRVKSTEAIAFRGSVQRAGSNITGGSNKSVQQAPKPTAAGASQPTQDRSPLPPPEVQGGVRDLQTAYEKNDRAYWNNQKVGSYRSADDYTATLRDIANVNQDATNKIERYLGSVPAGDARDSAVSDLEDKANAPTWWSAYPVRAALDWRSDNEAARADYDDDIALAADRVES